MKGKDVKGKIVILNGTSCSGKSTTARALQEIMTEPYMHVGLDHFEKMQPRKAGGYNQVFYGEGLGTRDLVPVMHACIAHMADEGVNVVVEHILLKRRWLKDAVERLSGYDPLFVGVWCLSMCCCKGKVNAAVAPVVPRSSVISNRSRRCFSYRAFLKIRLSARE